MLSSASVISASGSSTSSRMRTRASRIHTSVVNGPSGTANTNTNRDARSIPLSAVPDWYGFGMNVQITVRIPDDLVEFVDAEVARGTATSRADAVTRALVRERRRRAALVDVEILCSGGAAAGLDGLAQHSAANPVALDE